MCVSYDPDATAKMRKRKRRTAWKMIEPDGESPYHGASWGPGDAVMQNAGCARTARYHDPDSDAMWCGLHLCRARAHACCVAKRYGRRWKVVRVTTAGGENIRAADDEQFAVIRCTITKEDWQKAKLPKRAVRTRRI